MPRKLTKKMLEHLMMMRMKMKHKWGTGFLGDAWDWAKNLFKSGKVGKLASTVGDITGHKGISDLG